MIYLFALFLFTFIGYAVYRMPGAALMYVLLYQTFNKLVFEELGLGSLRHLFILGIVFTVSVLHYRKISFKANVTVLFKSGITKAYSVLFLTIFGYTIYFNTSYEYNYIFDLIYPNINLLLFAALLFFHVKMFNQSAIGMIVYSAFTLIAINLFKDFASIGFIERSEINASSGIGPLTQGKMAGIMALASILFFIETKSKKRWIYLIPVLISCYWMVNIGSRGAVLFLFLALSVYLLFSIRTVRSVFQIVVFALVLMPIIFFTDFDFSTTTLGVRSAELVEDGGLESTKRFYRILLFFRLLPDNIFIGLGPGGWGKYVMLGEYRYPHNIIIEAIIEFGIFGVLFLVLLVVSVLTIIRKSMRMPGFEFIGIRILAICWIYFALNTLTSGSLLNNSEFHVFNGLLIGMQSKWIQLKRPFESL